MLTYKRKHPKEVKAEVGRRGLKTCIEQQMDGTPSIVEMVLAV